MVTKRFARLVVVLTALGTLGLAPGVAEAICAPTVCYPQT